MRILFISYAESHSNKWVNALSKRGHEVFFVMQKSIVNHKDKLDPKIKVIELPVSGKKGYILNAPVLRLIYKRIKPDVVNVHYASGYGTMARLAGVKRLVLSVWGSDVYDFPYKSPLCMKLIKKNLLYADQIASTSNCMAQQVGKLIGNLRRITITPFGIDVDSFNPSRFKRKDDDTVVIGNIKVISPKYGIDDLIKAFSKVYKEFRFSKGYRNLSNKLRCVVYGNGEQTHEIEKLILELGLENKVLLPGEIAHDKVPEALSSIDIFCATSVLDSESFGVSVVEAEAMGIPIVATDVDGFKEVVEDGKTGYIVERKNVDEIAKKIRKLVLDENLREEMGKNGRKRVLSLYNFEDNVTTMEILLNSVKEGSNEK